MKKTVSLLVAAASALACATAMAQQHLQLPSQSEIDAKRKEVLNAIGAQAPNKRSVEQEMKSNRAATQAMGAQVPAGQAAASKEDFMNLVRPDAGKQQQGGQAQKAHADLLIFVSLSMPENMLRQYAEQAKRFNAILVLRGFVGDKLSTTREALVKLNPAGAQWDISPEPFKTFKIDKVPAIVMSTADSTSVAEDGCARPETYTAIYGDMSVYDALDKMALRAQPGIAQLAKARLIKDRQDGRKQ